MINIFQLAKKDAMQKTIVFQVFDWEKLGKAEVMGEVVLKFDSQNILFFYTRYKFLSGNLT